jgi:hypothetical protein
MDEDSGMSVYELVLCGVALHSTFSPFSWNTKAFREMKG